jgi:hypothetical protein
MTKARDIASAAPAPAGVTSTELGYVDGVTSALQTQIDGKIGSAAAINPTIVDAKGDIIAATAADTVARLAVGANNTVLTADSATATGLKWATPVAGGITLLSTSTLNNGTSAQNITGITGGSYKQILVTVDNMNTSGGQNWHFRLNSDTGSNYVRGYQGQYWAGGDAAVAGPDTQVYLGNRVSNQTGTWWKKGYGVFMIYNCSSSGQMIVDWKAISQDGGGGATFTYTTGIAIYNASAALTSFGFTLMDSTFTAGTVKVYGVN